MGFDRRLEFDVDGGVLVAGHAGAPLGRAPLVLAVHGITANHQSWAPVARLLGDEVTLIAPDLRGRAGSAALGPPYGLRAHADDLAAVLRATGATPCVVAGHSLGAYIVALLAARHPELASHVVLADGGLPIAAPEPGSVDVDVDAVLDVTLGPAIARLRQTFESVDAYRSFWSTHPAFATGKVPPDDLFAFADHDLTGEAPALRSTVREEAVRADGRDLLLDAEARGAADEIRCPITLLLAGRGFFDDPNPLLPRDEVARFVGRHPAAHVRELPDENHYTLLTGVDGSIAVAGAIRDALDAPSTVPG